MSNSVHDMRQGQLGEGVRECHMTERWLGYVRDQYQYQGIQQAGRILERPAPECSCYSVGEDGAE